MNSSSSPSSPNPGQLTKASGYDFNSPVQKVGAALNNTSAGGWGNSGGPAQPYGQFPGMGKQNELAGLPYFPTPGGSNNPINDWTDTRPPSESTPAMPNNSTVAPGLQPGENVAPPQPIPNAVGFEPWIPGGQQQAPQEPMLAYPPAPQVMPQSTTGPVLNPGYKPYEEPLPVQRKFPGLNGMMT